MSKNETMDGEPPLSSNSKLMEVESKEDDPTPKKNYNRKSRSASTWSVSRAKRSGAAMFKGRFCCCFSLQAGVCMYSSMGLVQMICIFITNIGGEIHALDHGHELIQFPILYIYVVAMMAGFGLTYFGTVKPSLKCLKIGNWIVFIFMIYWMIIACLSFVDKPKIVRNLCIDRRCPETQWMVKTYFRSYGNDCDEGEDPLIGDEELTEEFGKKDGDYHHQMNKTNELGDIGLEDKEKEEPNVDILLNASIPLEELENNTYTEYLDIPFIIPNISDDSISASNLPSEKVTQVFFKKHEATAEGTPSEEMYQKPGLEGLDISSFESRLIGCTTDLLFYKALSIFAMIFWAAFVVHGLVGAYFLIRQVRRMAMTGELDQALKHISYTQEQQENDSPYTIDPS